MQTNRNNAQSMTLVQCFSIFEKLAYDYLLSQVKLKKGILSFFRTCSDGEKIANTILETIRKTTASFDFPDVSLNRKISFLENCSVLYTSLKKAIQCNQSKNIDCDLFEFSHGFSSTLKMATYSILGNEIKNMDYINLNYLDYYIDSVSVGMDCPTNDIILKEEILTVLHNYVAFCKSSSVTPLVKSVFESIQSDNKSINCYTKNCNERFHNIIKFLDTFRLILSDKKEIDLLLAVEKVINRAFEFNFDIGRRSTLVAVLHDSKKQNKISVA